MRKPFLGAVALLLVTTACSMDFGSGSSGSADQADLTAQTTPLPVRKEPVIAVVKRVLPAVVNVTTDVFQPDQFGNPQEAQGVGTGFVVRQDGVVVTNCHVVEQASKITVSTSAAEPVQYDARVIGGDCINDLAILKAEATGLATVPLGNSDALRLGQTVVALGYALGLEGGPTVTTGVVSSLDRTIQVPDPNCETCGPNGVRTYESVVQTDAAINRGNSGGPLVNLQGQVIGINSAGTQTAENIGFAIAINSAKLTIEQAMTDPLAPSAYLGVSTQPLTSDLALQLGLPVDGGAYVVATTGGGPAQAAGIREGDVIVSVSGEPVSSSEDLGKVLQRLEPGQQAPVEVVDANGERRTIDVTLGTRPLPVGNIP
jgi:serine protease Do